jgi:[NiFe] hydrogenase assembly HybE family chaperone
MPQDAEFLAHFQAAGQRMPGLPFCNPALVVELLGWRDHGERGRVGVLIAPWCLNLLWLPPRELTLPGKGERVLLQLASGDYSCILHEEPRLGRYASASLCSSMQVFADQAAARCLAEEVLRLLFAEAERPAPLRRRELFRRALGGAA